MLHRVISPMPSPNRRCGVLVFDVVRDVIPLRAILDTSVLRAVLVSAAGASRALLLQVLGGRIRAMASTALLLQCEDVLFHPAMLAAAGLSVREVIDLLDDPCAMPRPVAIDVSWRPQSPDGDDDLVIEAVVNGLAAVIATVDFKDIREPAARFGIIAETPADVPKRIA